MVKVAAKRAPMTDKGAALREAAAWSGECGLHVYLYTLRSGHYYSTLTPPAQISATYVATAYAGEITDGGV